MPLTVVYSRSVCPGLSPVRSKLVLWSLAGWLLIGGCGSPESETNPPSSAANMPDGSVDRLWLRDSNEREVNPFSGNDTSAIVFLFTRADCLISNRYAPEVRRIVEDFTSQGVRFWLVYPNPAATPKTIRLHLAEFDYPCDALLDPDHKLVQLTGVEVTPEVAVFDRDHKLIYHGRIDDRYVDYGQTRPKPTRHDLKVVLKAVLDGHPVAEATTKAVGCFISDLQ